MADAPVIRAIFFRSTYDPFDLLGLIDRVCTIIRREGLRPDVEGREAEVVIYARPIRKADPPVQPELETTHTRETPS